MADGKRAIVISPTLELLRHELVSRHASQGREHAWRKLGASREAPRGPRLELDLADHLGTFRCPRLRAVRARLAARSAHPRLPRPVPGAVMGEAAPKPKMRGSMGYVAGSGARSRCKNQRSRITCFATKRLASAQRAIRGRSAAGTRAESAETARASRRPKRPTMAVS